MGTASAPGRSMAAKVTPPVARSPATMKLLLGIFFRGVFALLFAIVDDSMTTMFRKFRSRIQSIVGWRLCVCLSALGGIELDVYDKLTL
jgi:hypothetical protein